MQVAVLEKSFERPDQQWKLEASCADVVQFNGFTALRTTFLPGMLYSRDIRPYISAGKERFPTRIVYCQAGRMHQKQHDGAAIDYEAGGVYLVQPWDNGFDDSWVVGDEPCVLITVIPTDLSSTPDVQDTATETSGSQLVWSEPDLPRS